VDYMSPEQASNPRNADHRTDIYSLGCTLYFLLTGKTVYTGASAIEKLLAHRNDSIPSLRVARPEVPEALDAVFQRMVAKRPEDRFASMREVIVALQACQVSAGDGQGMAQRLAALEDENPWNFLGTSANVAASGQRTDGDSVDTEPDIRHVPPAALRRKSA